MLAKAWTGVADGGDAALPVKECAPSCGGRISDVPTDNGARAHDVRVVSYGP